MRVLMHTHHQTSANCCMWNADLSSIVRRTADLSSTCSEESRKEETRVVTMAIITFRLTPQVPDSSPHAAARVCVLQRAWQPQAAMPAAKHSLRTTEGGEEF